MPPGYVACLSRTRQSKIKYCQEIHCKQVSKDEEAAKQKLSQMKSTVAETDEVCRAVDRNDMWPDVIYYFSWTSSGVCRDIICGRYVVFSRPLFGGTSRVVFRIRFGRPPFLFV